MSDERNHEPSDRKRQKAREEGQLPKSRDVYSVACLLGAVLGLMAGYDQVVRSLMDFAHLTLGSLRPPSLEVVMRAVAAATMPALVGGVVACVLAGFAQNRGWLWVAVKADLTRLDPVAKLGQMYGSPESWLQIATSALKVALLGATAYAVLHAVMAKPLLTGAHSLTGAATIVLDVLGMLALACVLLATALAALDFWINHRKFERQLRMTTEEVKQEVKDTDGDPQIKARRRRRALELVKSRSVRHVPQANVVVVNPTHYAVAIRYDRSMRAPKVVAKGVDLFAKRIRDIAAQHGVPVLSRPPLARALYRSVPVNKEIPPELYRAVAVVLADVYRGKRRGLA